MLIKNEVGTSIQCCPNSRAMSKKTIELRKEPYGVPFHGVFGEIS
jgi:hypothetical protein